MHYITHLANLTVPAALLVCAGLAGLAALIALTLAAGSYALVKWLMRQQRYREAAKLVEREIQRIIAHLPQEVISDT